MFPLGGPTLKKKKKVPSFLKEKHWRVQTQKHITKGMDLEPSIYSIHLDPRLIFQEKI